MLMFNMTIRKFILCLLLMFLALTASSPAMCQSNSGEILFSQKLFRDDVMFFGLLRDLRGTVFLKGDSLVFVVSKIENKRFGFAVHYSQIKSIRRTYWTLFPNRICIHMKKGCSYSLRTYKRKRIIEVAKGRMKALA